MALPLLLSPEIEGARVSTTKMQTSYFGTGGIWGKPDSRSWVRRAIHDHLRVAVTDEERERVANVVKHVHYLANGKWPVRYGTWMSYILDLPGWRAPNPGYIPAACVTIKYAFIGGLRKIGMPALCIESWMQVLEITRTFVADDVREINDFTPALLREVVARMRKGYDWAWNNNRLEKSVRWQPKWLVSYADPTVGHDGGSYQGAGGKLLSVSKKGKLLFGWELT